MKTLTLYVPLEGSVREFLRLVRMFKNAGYRFSDAVVRDEVAGITFEYIGANEKW